RIRFSSASCSFTAGKSYVFDSLAALITCDVVPPLRFVVGARVDVSELGSWAETSADRSTDWGINLKYSFLFTMDEWPAYSLIPFYWHATKVRPKTLEAVDLLAHLL